ncbi:Six-hairpin glycosidase-like protein [Pterulicium gracile]|uniref:Six-hairpin glycosidase-like protein n=1 Tax=Pterulicium gracile TaxID=1884261 RepID=A0A5C3QUB7_9AGAR|nr:Six-hairpin glycosidase-like protein [Pterula gracilis]
MPRLPFRSLVLLVAAPTLVLSAGHKFDTTLLDKDTLAKARVGLLHSAVHSWELGAATQALLEHSWPDLSVFNPDVFPLPATLPDGYAGDVLDIAKLVVSRMGPNDTTLIDGDGSSADPASLGMAVMLTDLTLTDKSNHTFADAAAKQLKHILESVPRASNGAISHREKYVQLWADYMYMVPPFLSFAGATQHNATLLKESYDQCKSYREILRSDNGLWKHILLGDWSDPLHWNTGNGWAAAGMMRVLKTIQYSSLSQRFVQEQRDLARWTQELAESAWKYQGANGTLFNVIDNSTWFPDTAGTAMMASATYRLATHTGDYSLIPFAEKAFQLIKDSIDEEGRLLDTVDPLSFYEPLRPPMWSPEGQAFVLVLQAAKKEFLEKVKRGHHG